LGSCGPAATRDLQFAAKILFLKRNTLCDMALQLFESFYPHLFSEIGENPCPVIDPFFGS
jgi:hypothetical protein